MTPPPKLALFDLAAGRADAEAALHTVWHRVLADGRFVGGPFVAEFEAAFAAFCGARSCVGVGNGTDALELLLEALGIGRGDDVLVPANTFVATAEAVVRVGARPVFCDVDADRLLLRAEDVTARSTPATVAVIAVHLFGQACDMDEISAAADRLGIAVIEDAAQAHGAAWNGRRVGSFGVGAAFSFYPSKNLGALGDGGAVTTNDAALAETVRSLANHGIDTAAHDRRHVRPGRNTKLDALQAAVLTLRLTTLDDDNRRRRQVAEHYRRVLPAPFRPLTTAPGDTPVHHLQVVRCATPREQAVAALEAAGIGWGVHYPTPCHRLPWADHPGDPLPVAERAAQEILSLPMGPTLSEQDVDRVADTLAALDGVGIT